MSKASGITWRIRNREKEAQRSRDWRAAHKGATTAVGRAWRAANPDKVKAELIRNRDRRRLAKLNFVGPPKPRKKPVKVKAFSDDFPVIQRWTTQEEWYEPTSTLWQDDYRIW